MMWRIAKNIYRVFRNTATHRCPQDVFVPLSTCNTDDENSLKDGTYDPNKQRLTVDKILKKYQYSYNNVEKLRNSLNKLSLQSYQENLNLLNVLKIYESKQFNEQVSLNANEACTKTIKTFSDLQDETMSIINLQLALEAFESEDFETGIAYLRISAKDGTNAAALYNLGLCYEQGIGVETDRAKACDYYCEASALGHVHAQFKLTSLSNDIDIDESEEEVGKQVIGETKPYRPIDVFTSFSISNIENTDQFYNSGSFDFNNKTVACLS